MKKPKIAVIGAGQVGATTALRLIEKNLCDVVLFDIVDGLAEGKALDLMEAAPVEGHECKIVGTTHYQDIAGCDIVIVTAGLARKPGMSREDLLIANAKIIRSVSDQVKKNAPNSVVIIVTNPLDIMTFLFYKLSGFDKSRVMGMAGVLDSARMRYFIAEATHNIPRDVSATVLGGHGDLMVPIMSQAKIQGKPLSGLSDDETAAIIKRTRQGGAEIVGLLKTGSAFYAPASSIALMVRAIVEDSHAVLPVCAFLSGEYGINGIYSGVPCQLGRKGIEKIIELPLKNAERNDLRLSADKVLKGVQEVEKLTF